MLISFLKRLLSFLMRKLKLADLDSFIYERRLELANQVDEENNSTIQIGPFKGMRLSQGDWWGKIDRPSMIFGFYEKEVLESLASLKSKYNTLIDLGAADGYYAIGAVFSGLFEQSVCYEIEAEGQKQIKKNAIANNVLDFVKIRGEAKKNFYDEFTQEELDSSVILLDVEGEEFNIFSKKEDFLKLKKSTIIIESHALYFDDGYQKQKNLINIASEFFNVTELKMSSRDLSNIEYLEKFSDSDRWLMCSEGRGQLMSWIRLDPK